MKVYLQSLSGFSLLLFSCASLVTIEETDDNWIVEAKVSYHDNQQAKNGFLRWEQQGEDYEMRLSGSLTGELARLRKTDGQFELRAKGRNYQNLNDINSAVAETTGMHIPAESLQYWIKAEPNPISPFNEKRDGKGRLVYLAQDLWQIHYADYRKGLATHIVAERPPYRIVLVILLKKRQPSQQL